MNAPNFANILNKPIADVERPKPLPVGTYTAVVQGLPRQDVSAKKETPFVEFTLKLLSAEEDVDKEELTAMGGLTDKTIKDTYYLTDTALWRLKDFLTNCGIDVDAGTIGEAIDATPNCTIGVVIKHEPSQDGQTVFARVAKTISI